uniref:Transmembrane protein 230 n=1 Tax=Poecilia mexicana TaxID=48701 RepID=A0A3B3Z002_9TELE
MRLWNNNKNNKICQDPPLHQLVISSSRIRLRFIRQFKRSPPKVPYKAIALASVLFLIGSTLIIIGALLLAGYFGVTNSDRTVPVLIIGIIVFLPGIYHLRIAYYASKGYPGYSYDDIPDFDD